jgi:hypothetical protein
MKVATLEVMSQGLYPLILTECSSNKFRRGDKFKVAEEMIGPMLALYSAHLKRVGPTEDVVKLANGHWEPWAPQKEITAKPEPVSAEPIAEQEKPKVMGGNKSMAGKSKTRTKAVDHGASNAS